MKSNFLLIAFFCLIQQVVAQQNVRGNIVEKESQRPVSKIQVTLEFADTNWVAETNEQGNFEFNHVLVGRVNVMVSGQGYKMYQQNNVIVTTGKEVILKIELESEITDIKTAEVTIKGKSNAANNEHSLVSSRLFTVEETDRYAGSRGDPARMASNFAGVQGADDSRNDIVIRGNSPSGVVWRLEGIDIPNPNHFAIPGTTGGPVSIINNKVLANSDFFTGAFPAEYGNGIAGVFDLKMRNGNNQKHEFSTQFGFLGWDVMAEGPLSKKTGASYMLTYRYSTLALFGAMNIKIGTDAIPFYQDASFKVHLPLKNGKQLNFFGIGGISDISILISDQKETGANLYGDDDRDQIFGSKMGVVGAWYQMPLAKKSYFKAIATLQTQMVDAHHELVFRTITDTFQKDGKNYFRYQLDSLIPNLYYRFKTRTDGLHVFINTPVNKALTFRYGIQIQRYGYQYFDSARNFDSSNSNKYWKWFVRWNSKATGMLYQPYFQLRYLWKKNWVFSAGLHAQGFTLISAEKIKYTEWSGPELRVGARYQINRNSSLNAGMGMHSQIQPGYTYFYQLEGNNKPHNLAMKMTKSLHYVLGYTHGISKNTRLKAEAYYQSLYKIPVTIKPSSFSLANTGSGFARFFPDTLENSGKGYNYGLELTLERIFVKGYYFLITASVFDAQYQGSDGIWRSSDFNTRYALNMLFSREWVFKKKNALNLGGKWTMAGARRYSPMDTMQTLKQREYIENDAQKNSLTFGEAYFRLDIRISYRLNAKKVSHEFALDLVNVTNRKNILKYSFVSEPPYYRLEYQLGFLPIFYYKMDF